MSTWLFVTAKSAKQNRKIHQRFPHQRFSPRLSLWKLWIQRNAEIISWTWSSSLTKKIEMCYKWGTARIFNTEINPEIGKILTLVVKLVLKVTPCSVSSAKWLRCRPCHRAPRHPPSRSSKASLRSWKTKIHKLSQDSHMNFRKSQDIWNPKNFMEFQRSSEIWMGILESLESFESWSWTARTCSPPSCSQGSEKRSYLTHGIQAALLETATWEMM